MKRAFYMFMCSMKFKKTTNKDKMKGMQKPLNQSVDVPVDNAGTTDMFDDDMYDQSDFRTEMFTDNFYEEYGKEINKTKSDVNILAVDKDFRVTRKEALTSIETKSPFIVGKMSSKKSCIEDDDIVYRTVPKLSYKENHKISLVGHMEVFKTPRTKRFSEKKLEKSLGVLNDEYVVSKKKGFNQSKLGYLKLEDDDSDFDRYIQINESKGLKPLLWIIIIVGLLLLLSKLELPDDWNFDKFTLYQVQEKTENQDISVEVLHDERITVLDSVASMQFQTIAENELSVEIVISCNGKEIYRSERMSTSKYADAGSLEFMIEGYRAGEYNCSLVCEVYRTNKYIGKLESKVIMSVE